MQAIAVFPKEKKVALIDHPEPKIELPTQVKLKILDVGICGTDREICEFKYGTPPADSDYLIIGHECLAQVVEVGANVKNFTPGDLVVVMVRRPCQYKTCIACQMDQQDFCYTGEFTERGINGQHGFMAEYVVSDEKYILKVPKKLREIGVLTEPLTIAEKTMREIFTIQKRLPWGRDLTKKSLHALIIGAGPIGLLAALVFSEKQFNIDLYSLESKTDARAKMAAALGARYFSAQEFSVEKLKSFITENVDVIFDGSGASLLAFQLFALLGYNGIFVWTGIPGKKEPIDIHTGTIMRNLVLKNQSVLGSVNASKIDFENAICDLSVLWKRLQHFDYPVIKRFPVKNYRELLLAPPPHDILKCVLQFG